MKLLIKISKTALIVFTIFLPFLSFGQNDTVKILIDLGTHYDYAYSIAIQPDGKVIVGGDAYGVPCMIRFDTSGVLDNTFGSEGKVFASWDCGSNPSDNDIKIQSDGKIILGTSYLNEDYNTDFIVARYNIDGSPDNLFGENGHIVTQIGESLDQCTSIALQSDNKILAGGYTSIGQSYDFAIIRYNPEGTIDNTFGNNGMVTTHIGMYYSFAYSMAVQQDGKIIMAGVANDSIFSDFAIVRYNPDGSLDYSFGNSGIVRTALSETYDYAASIVLQSDEKILVAGTSNEKCALVRYNADGSLDDTFGINGVAITAGMSLAGGTSLALHPDNKIVVAGSTTNSTIWDFATWQFNTDGTLDRTFGANGMITASFGYGDSGADAVAIGENGEIISAGYFNHGYPNYMDFAILRLFSNLNSIPILLSPPDGAIEQPTELTMTWQPVSGGESYNVQLSTSSSFDNDVIYASGLPTASFSVSGLENYTTYYWRVSSNSIADGTSDWSNYWAFTTELFTQTIEFFTEEIKLYPLPITDKLFIKGIEGEKVTVLILSVDGKIVKYLYEYSINEIDLSNIPNGIYIIRILNSKINFTKKIIKQ